MEKITLDDFIQQVQQVEEHSAEPVLLTEKIAQTAGYLYYEIKCAVAEERPVILLLDYDCDGISSGYIMLKTLQHTFPEADISGICNDRRGNYGVPKYIEHHPDALYIVQDMGSNEMEYIDNVLGKDTIVIDHHLIEDELIQSQFQQEARLLNPQAFKDENGNSAGYCATGLAYRIYESFVENNVLQPTEKLHNTLTAMATIGTITDVMPVLDPLSRNREIIRAGIEAINNATPANMDNILLYMMQSNGMTVGQDVSARNVAFMIGAFINSASRMSEIVHQNGAQRMFDALTGEEHFSKPFLAIDTLVQWNADRKKLIMGLQKEESYQEFIRHERYESKENLAIYVTNQEIPSSFCGLIAGRLEEAIDKAVIVLSKKGDTYTGSGRNIETNETSLKDFIDSIVQGHEEGLGIIYGGHKDAIGISRLDNLPLFQELIQEHISEITRKEESFQLLDISLEELKKPETLEKITQLEPIGEGLQLPKVKVEGKMTKATKKGVKSWATLTFREGTNQLTVNDWNYDDESYPKGWNGKKSTIANISISYFKAPLSKFFEKINSELHLKMW